MILIACYLCVGLGYTLHELVLCGKDLEFPKVRWFIILIWPWDIIDTILLMKENRKE